MRVWRLTRPPYLDSAFEGTGSATNGGRWNAPGSFVVYTAEHLSLAALEVLVHFDPDLTPNEFLAIPADVPDTLIGATVSVQSLPARWRTEPAGSELLAIGKAWLGAGVHVALVVPSAVIPHEHNVLLNPLHPDFAQVRVGTPEPFSSDGRLA